MSIIWSAVLLDKSSTMSLERWMSLERRATGQVQHDVLGALDVLGAPCYWSSRARCPWSAVLLDKSSTMSLECWMSLERRATGQVQHDVLLSWTSINGA